jgi:hypothetical protein
VVTSRAARISALPKEPKRLTKGHGGRGQGGLNGTRSSVWSDPDTALRLMICAILLRDITLMRWSGAAVIAEQK